MPRRNKGARKRDAEAVAAVNGAIDVLGREGAHVGIGAAAALLAPTGTVPLPGTMRSRLAESGTVLRLQVVCIAQVDVYGHKVTNPRKVPGILDLPGGAPAQQMDL